jgi:hypothetical protein
MNIVFPGATDTRSDDVAFEAEGEQGDNRCKLQQAEDLEDDCCSQVCGGVCSTGCGGSTPVVADGIYFAGSLESMLEGNRLIYPERRGTKEARVWLLGEDKRNFFTCYQKARKEALSAKNIKSDWKAIDLWPKSMARPLMGSLLLENINKPRNTPNQASGSSVRDSRSDWSVETSQVIWPTPKKSTELKAQTVEFKRLQDQDQSSSDCSFGRL